MPLRRNPLFVGRTTDLRHLAAALHVGETAAIGNLEIAAATGLGGIGKTQLACEFVHRYGQFFPGGVFWLSFADPAAVAAEIAACGGSEGMQLSPAFGTLPLDEQVQRVIAAWTSPLPRLLVFDNCEEEALLEQWRPKHGGCRILLTSRRHHWDPALGVEPLALDVLPRADSLALLRQFRPDLPEHDADLQAIAETLGDLPLALHLAGSFLAKYRHALTPAQYCARLQVPAILDDRSLRDTGLSPTQHMQHVARTFAQSYERLDPADPMDALARTLLAHAACFAPGEPLTRSLLIQTLDLPGDDADRALHTEDALTRVIDLGLLYTDAAGVLRLHRLLVGFVRAVVRYEAAQAAVEAAILRVAHDLNQTYNLRPLLALQPHLRWITDAAQQRADVRAAALCHTLGLHIWRLGVYPEAQPYLERAVAIRQRVLGDDHLDTAQSLHNLGVIFHEQGQYEAAQRSYTQALAIRQRLLGDDHPDTAASFNNLGQILAEQGQYAEALGYHEQALAIRQRLLGDDHRDTAASFNNLGIVLQEQGQYAQALSYHQRALAIWRRVLGDEHPYTAMTLNSLGEIFYEQQQHATAQRYLEQGLAILERALGLHHPYTARNLHKLGEVLIARGEQAQARHYLEQALAIFEQRLGPQHASTEGTRRTLKALEASQE
jgi:tetratricopeptide (TPR) repeat protein